MPRLPQEWVDSFPTMTSYRLGACDTAGRPSVCRALAARLEPDGTVLTLVSRVAGRVVLAAIEATGQVAALMVSPVTNRTLHLKGRDARVEPATPAQAALLESHRAALATSLRADGFLQDSPVIANWYGIPVGDLMAVRFTPWGAWNQTPGPGAGEPVELLP